MKRKRPKAYTVARTIADLQHRLTRANHLLVDADIAASKARSERAAAIAVMKEAYRIAQPGSQLDWLFYGFLKGVGVEPQR